MNKVINFRSYVLRFLVLLSLAFVFMLLPRNTLISEATNVEFNLDSSDTALGGTYEGGYSSANRSGWLIYIVDKSGNAVSPNSVLWSTNGYAFGGASIKVLDSKLGGYSNPRTPFSFNAPWGPPNSPTDFSSRASDIKSWFSTMVGSYSNAYLTIRDLWGTSVADNWVDNDHVLILEPVHEVKLYFQYELVVARGGIVTNFGKFNSSNGGSYVVATASNMAREHSSFIASKRPTTKRIEAMDVTCFYLPLSGVSSSPLASAYLKAVPHAVKLSTSIGSLPAGVAGNSYLSVAQIENTGVGMMGITASGSLSTGGGGGGAPVVPVGTYTGSLITLSATAGVSTSNGDSYWGAEGVLDIFNASASSNAAQLSYDLTRRYNLSTFGGGLASGIYASVVPSGTGYSIGVYNNICFKTGAIFAETADFKTVSVVNPSNSATYRAISDGYLSSLYPKLDLVFSDNGSRVLTYQYTEDLLHRGGFNSISYGSQSFELTKQSLITYSNSRPDNNDMPVLVNTASYYNMTRLFENIYYNRVDMTSDNIFRQSDLYKAYEQENANKLLQVKRDGTLAASWQYYMEADRRRVATNAGAQAFYNWTLIPGNKRPDVVKSPTELGLTALSVGYADALAAYNAYLVVLNNWSTQYEAVRKAAYDASYAAYNTTAYTYTNTSPPITFNVQYSGLVFENELMASDKINIQDGPDKTYKEADMYKKGWIAEFYLHMLCDWSGDTSNVITYMPFTSGGITTTPGTVGDFSDIVNNIKVRKCDFILGDGTSKDLQTVY